MNRTPKFTWLKIIYLLPNRTLWMSNLVQLKMKVRETDLNMWNQFGTVQKILETLFLDFSLYVTA